jgi:3-oxoadipate enol-lactonase
MHDTAAIQGSTMELIGPAPRIAVEHMGSGPLVVFMHGIGGNRTNWRDQLPTFARHFHAVAWDARGYGASDDYEGPLTYNDFCRDLVRVLDYFKVDKAHLVGLSMGGFIAQDFYGRYPQRVASLVLADTRPGWEQAFDPAAREEFLRLRVKPLQEGKGVAEMAPAVARSLMGASAGEGIFARLVESMAVLHKESYMKSIEARGSWKPVLDPKSVAVPTLVVVGAEDRLTPPPMARSVAAAIRGAQLAEIPAAGHLSNIEQPAAFNEVVLGFLTALR